MRVAAFNRRPWPSAVRIAGDTCIELPSPPNAAHFETGVEDAVEHGRRLYELLKGEQFDLIADTHGDGLLFVDDPREKGMGALLHEKLGVPLVSNFTETIRILYKRFDPVILQQALQSRTWFKGIFTKGHIEEMEWLGIPGCFYLPLAIDDAEYALEKPNIDKTGPKVLFAGHQQSQYFAHADGVDVRTQWPGALAVASAGDGSSKSFLEAYDRFELGPRPTPEDGPERRAEIMKQYFAKKMFFAASRNLANRDRFVLLLKKRLGDDFLLMGGDRWQRFYGLSVRGRVEYSEYMRLLRSTPVCVNFANGDNDTGLNLRHFEITAAGGFLLSYRQPELGDLFEVGRECASFRNEGELLEKIGYYVEHPEERNAIAMAGRARTLRCHLLHHRYKAVRSWLREEGHV